MGSAGEGGGVRAGGVAFAAVPGPRTGTWRTHTPSAVKLEDGSGYRMYYTGRGPAHPDPDAIGYVLSAHSDDADT